MRKTLATVSIAAMAAVLCGPIIPSYALADCTAGSQDAPGYFASNYYYGVEGNWPYGYSGNYGTYTGEGDCVTPEGHSYGIGLATTGEITIDDFGQAWYNAPTTFVYGPNSTALGNGAIVGERSAGEDGIMWTDDDVINPVTDGTAIGARANVQHDHSTAIGADAASSTDHEVTLGTSEDTVRAPGITSQLSKDRQTGSLEVVTTDANGNLASDGGATFAAIQDNAMGVAANRADIETGYGLIQDNRNDIDALNADMETAFEGVAMSMAMDVPQVDESKRFALSVNWGTFEGENAFAAGAAFRIDPNWQINGGAGVGVSSGAFGGKVGVLGQF